MSDVIPVPQQVIEVVERWVDKELRDAEKYENRTPMDESGIFSLHRMSAEVYAAGFDAGERAAEARARGYNQRRRDRESAVDR